MAGSGGQGPPVRAVSMESDRWARWEGSHPGRGRRGALYVGARCGGYSGVEIQPPLHLPRHVEYRATLTGRKGLLSLMPTKVLEGSEGLPPPGWGREEGEVIPSRRSRARLQILSRPPCPLSLGLSLASAQFRSSGCIRNYLFFGPKTKKNVDLFPGLLNYTQRTLLRCVPS